MYFVVAYCKCFIAVVVIVAVVVKTVKPYIFRSGEMPYPAAIL